MPAEAAPLRNSDRNKRLIPPMEDLPTQGSLQSLFSANSTLFKWTWKRSCNVCFSDISETQRERHWGILLLKASFRISVSNAWFPSHTIMFTHIMCSQFTYTKDTSPQMRSEGGCALGYSQNVNCCI